MLTVALLMGIAFGVAAGFHPLLRFERPLLALACATFCLILLPLPLVLESRLGRLVAAIGCGLLALKIIDVSVGAAKGHRPNCPTYLAYLPNFGSFVLRKANAEPAGTRCENVIHLFRGTALMACGFLLLKGLYVIAWGNWPFFVEHLCKTLGFFVGVLGLFESFFAIARLMGARARNPHHAPLAARTPADFWRRYNRPIQQFFHENVFKPFGDDGDRWC